MKQAARNNIGAIEERSLRLEREINRIKTILSGRDDILRVILFGSFAQGRTDAFSDLDIIIIQDPFGPVSATVLLLFQDHAACNTVPVETACDTKLLSF